MSNLPTIAQIVSNTKRKPPGSTCFEPCQGGWIKTWKDQSGRVWSEFREDNEQAGFPVTLKVEFDPANPKIRKGTYNFSYFKRAKQAKLT